MMERSTNREKEGSFVRHLVITGVRQIGKSTLANRYLTARGVEYAGYRTKVREQTEVGPIYEMEELLTGNRQPISRLEGDHIAGIPETFEGFGAEVIRRGMESDASVLLLDEIGRFERSSPQFLSALMDSFSTKQQVVAVLKQEKLPYLEAIKAREDILLVDLDTITRETAWTLVREEFLQ